MKEITKRQYPVRRWSIEGFPGTGKSTFAARLRGPQVVVDADGRYEEVVGLVAGKVYAASDGAANVEIAGIERGLDTTLKGNLKAATIIVDSITQIINPIIGKLMMGELSDGQVIKAMVMRRLATAVCKWGTDVLFVYHLYEAGLHGKNTVKATLTDQEQDRLMLNLNLKLATVYDPDNNRYGVKVLWARNGRQFPAIPVLWDETGSWEGMPEAIEKAVYGNGKPAEAKPVMFKSIDEALTWSVEQHCYPDVAAAQTAYNTLKGEIKPTSARQMFEAWLAFVERRRAQHADAGIEVPNDGE